MLYAIKPSTFSVVPSGRVFPIFSASSIAQDAIRHASARCTAATSSAFCEKNGRVLWAGGWLMVGIGLRVPSLVPPLITSFFVWLPLVLAELLFLLLKRPMNQLIPPFTQPNRSKS